MSATAPTDERDRPDISAAIQELFGDRVALAERYAEVLVTEGIDRGMIGPREADRVWERHLLNSAALSALIPPAVRVIDLGSGAGLPGIPLAIARPDLHVTLLEPLQRRLTFLTHCLETLDLSNTTVHHGRAEDGVPELADVVVCRAVASLDKTLRLSFSLLGNNGVLLSLKGASVTGELEQVRREMNVDAEVLSVPAPGQPATVVRAMRSDAWAPLPVTTRPRTARRTNRRPR